MTNLLDISQDTAWDRGRFIDRVVDPMTGWLDRYAAKRTLDLLDYQERQHIDGALYEVGLFRGKYFSLLVRSAARTSSRVVGIDTFDYVSANEFKRDFFARMREADIEDSAARDIRIVEGSSGDIPAGRLLDMLGQEARFISIDGSHEYDDVLWDLNVADQVLAPGGIVSADDFLHPICLGVTAAIFHYLESAPNIVPFAHVSNKLFLCRPDWADRYRTALEEAILDDEGDVKSDEFRAHFRAGRRRDIESEFRGYRVLTIRL